MSEVCFGANLTVGWRYRECPLSGGERKSVGKITCLRSAPIPAVRRTAMEPRGSTLNCRSNDSRQYGPDAPKPPLRHRCSLVRSSGARLLRREMRDHLFAQKPDRVQDL